MHNLVQLLHLVDPTLPIGGFSHSAGLETYVQLGKVKDAESAKIFVYEMLTKNIHYTDAAFVSLAFNAANEKDIQALLQLDIACSAVKLPEEMRLASYKMGRRLLKIFQPLEKNELIESFQNLVKSEEASGHYCVVFGLVAAVSGIEKLSTLTGFYYNAAVGFVTNCVKLIPLSQQSGQEILHGLSPTLSRLAEKNLIPDENRIGLCCPGFDIKSMQHEALYSRLYMS